MVAELKQRYQFDVEVVKKPEVALLKRILLPRFPAMEIDDELFFEDNTCTIEELEQELLRRNALSLEEGV